MADVLIFPKTLFNHSAFKEPLRLEVQQILKDNLWPRSTSSMGEFSQYFRYFQWTIFILPWPDIKPDPMEFATQNYRDIVTVSRSTELHVDCDRMAIANKLREDFPTSTRKPRS